MPRVGPRAGGFCARLPLPDGLVGDDVAMSVRTCIFALACLLAGATLFVGACLGAIVFLFERHCGPAFGYYGCDIPTANIQREVDSVARLRADSRRLELRAHPQGLGTSDP